MNGLFKILVLPNRVGRLQFIKIILCLALVGLIIFCPLWVIDIENTPLTLDIILICTYVFYAVFHFCYLMYLYTKRLHDLGFNGWIVVFTFIPIANIILLVILFFVPGSEGNNQFGPASSQ